MEEIPMRQISDGINFTIFNKFPVYDYSLGDIPESIDVDTG